MALPLVLETGATGLDFISEIQPIVYATNPNLLNGQWDVSLDFLIGDTLADKLRNTLLGEAGGLSLIFRISPAGWIWTFLTSAWMA